MCIHLNDFEVCSDNYVGYLFIEGNSVNHSKLWFKLDKRIENRTHLHCIPHNQENKNIVIILESPHKDEYDDSNFINPALGSTGNKLDIYFEKMLIEAIPRYNINNGHYAVILMNTIQYPCSLLNNPLNKVIRDRTFLHGWLNDYSIRSSFESRLRRYKPSIIINCCTAGQNISKRTVEEIMHIELQKNQWTIDGFYSDNVFQSNHCEKKYFLHGFVQTAIDAIIYEEPPKLLRSTHPCFWNRNSILTYYHNR